MSKNFFQIIIDKGCVGIIKVNGASPSLVRWPLKFQCSYTLVGSYVRSTFSLLGSFSLSIILLCKDFEVKMSNFATTWPITPELDLECIAISIHHHSRIVD